MESLMHTSTKRPLVRLQFDFPESQVAEIDALMEQTGLSTRKLFIEYALACFKWAASQAGDGRAVVSYDQTTNSYRELSMPPLDVIRGNFWEDNGNDTDQGNDPPVNRRRTGAHPRNPNNDSTAEKALQSA
jgi:hypothetical protein